MRERTEKVCEVRECGTMPEPARHKEIGKLVQFHLVDERLRLYRNTDTA